MAVVSLKDVHKFYPLGKERIEAVRGVSFDIEKGEFAAIIGPSGSGKSTLLRSLNLLELPDGGSILVDGVDITDPKV
ncbi:MAG: ATP-binding cassette domain-containing protein, partial [Treponema sp.]|nr:ATP-binding cassette domain-containing protein [Treponema sp.]